MAQSQSDGHQSAWVHLDSTGKLAYRSLPAGDHIMDFSFAGYGGGGVAIPDVAVKKTITPSGSDDTSAIQTAIDQVSAMPLDDGFRGAVLLSPGVFHCSDPLSIKTSGVVLRGSGSATNGTVLRMVGKPHLCISIAGQEKAEEGEKTPITDAYVPSGASSFNVANPQDLHVGQTIFVVRPTTPPWVKFMGMNSLVRNGKPEHWVSGNLEEFRTITAIDGNRLSIDVPLSDSLDAHYLKPPGASVVPAHITGAISQVGVENLRIESPPQPIAISDPQNKAIAVDDAVDAWVRNLQIIDTIDSVGSNKGSRRLTFQNLHITHSVATRGAAKPGDFGTEGSQVLFDRCTGNGDNLFYFATGARVIGPNVLLNCHFAGHGWIQPHQRWATGLLVDHCDVPDGGIEFMNRGIYGSGHGWTLGWGVAWNCTAKSFLIQQPPGSTNWAIGCTGEQTRDAAPGSNKNDILPTGIIDSPGTPVVPQSLYLAQLKQRLGPDALKNIGY